MLLRFSPLRRRKAWRQAAERLGGTYAPGRFGHPDAVQVPAADTTITVNLDESLYALRGGRVRLAITDDEGPLGPTYPERVDVLQTVVPEPLADAERIVRLLRLFEAVLTALTVPQGEDPVAREIRRLRSPGARVAGRGDDSTPDV